MQQAQARNMESHPPPLFPLPQRLVNCSTSSSNLARDACNQPTLTKSPWVGSFHSSPNSVSIRLQITHFFIPLCTTISHLDMFTLPRSYLTKLPDYRLQFVNIWDHPCFKSAAPLKRAFILSVAGSKDLYFLFSSSLSRKIVNRRSTISKVLGFQACALRRGMSCAVGVTTVQLG